METTPQSKWVYRPQPVRYTERHRQVAVLRGLGKRRAEICARTGFSKSHVSRILRMPEAERDIKLVQQQWKTMFVEEEVKRLMRDIDDMMKAHPPRNFERMKKQAKW